VSLLGYLKILPSLFGLLELTGNCSFNFGAAQFLGRYAGLFIHWFNLLVFCYGMSLASQRLERKLNIGQIKLQ